MRTLGELVQGARQARGYATQKAFAEALGKDQSWVSRLEKGLLKETPGPDDLAALADALGLSVRDLLIAAGYAVGEETTVDQIVTDGAVRRIVRDLDGLTSGQLKHVQQLLDVLHGRPLD